MKKTKAILMALCAVLLVAASVMGTLAYLTSTATVTNTFTVGKVEIKLDEAAVNAEGKLLNSAGGVYEADKGQTLAPRVKENTYKLLPGHTYEKDPIIHVASTSEDCYLFVKVVNQIAAIEAAGDTTVAAQMEAKGWKAVEGQAGVFVYTNNTDKPVAVAANANVTVFENFTISGDVTNTQLADYAGKTIVIDAYAVQKDGFENKDAAYIWGEAFGETATTPTTDPAVAE